MNRRSVIRCILGLAAAPKILSEIDFKPPIIPTVGATKSLIADLQILTPQFYKTMVEKYEYENFTLTAEQFQKECNNAQLSYFMEVIGDKEHIRGTDDIWYEMKPKQSK